MRAVTVKVQGQPPDAQPAGETDTYAQGEVVGLAGEFVVVRGPQTFVLVWIKIRDGRPSPVVEPKEFKVSEGDAGKKFFFTLRGADAGDYAVGLVRPAGGNQYQPIVIRRFKVQ